MSDTQKKVFIAESSKIVLKLLKIQFENAGFIVYTAEDGLQAFEDIIELKPDTIVIDEFLSVINGPQLSCLVKESSCNRIPIIVFSVEGTVSEFVTDNCGVDEIVYINGSDASGLIDIVNKRLHFAEIEPESVKGDKTKGSDVPTICAAKAIEKTQFYMYILQTCQKLTNDIANIDLLIEKIFKLLYRICCFDAAVLILDDKPYPIYLSDLKGLPKKEFEDLLRICRASFEANFSIIGNNYYERKIVNISGFSADFRNKKFNSYKTFPIKSEKKVIGTLHIISTQKYFFYEELNKLLNFFTPCVASVLEQAILYKNISAKEKKMRQAFSKFVPQEIIDDLLFSQDKKSSALNEKRKVAILICDIRNFTTISESNQPENVVGFLNGYFSRMVNIIKQHGGSIDKFMGDAIMALFGVPVSYEDNAQRALEAALEMIETLPQINTSQITFPEGIVFDVGIGIHYGEAIVGSIGCEEKSDYTVIGDTVNLASRLEGLTKVYKAHIIVSGSVIEELKKNFNILNVDTVKVKGKHLGVPIFRADINPLPEDYVHNYEKGLSLYTSGAWNLASEYFKKALEIIPEEKSASLLLSRCEEFIKSPPENWTGAISLTTK